MMHTTTFQSVPRAPALPLVGSLPALMAGQFGALDRWQRDLGGLFDVALGPGHFVLVGDAELATEVLIDKAGNFVRSGPFWESLSNLFGNGMLTSEGEVWRERRRMIQPHFHQNGVRAMVDGVARSIDETLAGWKRSCAGGLPWDASQKSAEMTMGITLRVIFGDSVADNRFQEVGQALWYAIDRVALGWVTSNLPPWLPIPGRRRYSASLETIDRLLSEIVRSRREQGQLGEDVLGMLLHIVDRGGLDAAGLRDESVSLFIAGYETTGNSLGWAMWELGESPEISGRLREEADRVLEGGVTPEKVERLEYATQVFKEAMRMYPGSVWVPRQAVSDDTIGGRPVAAGTNVVVSIYNVHNDPRVWDAPRRFDPGRFAPGVELPHRHAWMPFGLGQHMCIGLRLAMLEGPLALARIAQELDIETLPDRRPRMKLSTGLRSADGIWVRMKPRRR